MVGSQLGYKSIGLQLFLVNWATSQVGYRSIGLQVNWATILLLLFVYDVSPDDEVACSLLRDTRPLLFCLRPTN